MLVFDFPVSVKNSLSLDLAVSKYLPQKLSHCGLSFKDEALKIFNYPFASLYNSYYAGDLISRASRIMGLCRISNEKKLFNFLKNGS